MATGTSDEPHPHLYHLQDGFCSSDSECCDGLACGLPDDCGPNMRCGTVCRKPAPVQPVTVLPALPEALCPENKAVSNCLMHPCAAVDCMQGMVCVADYCKGCSAKVLTRWGEGTERACVPCGATRFCLVPNNPILSLPRVPCWWSAPCRAAIVHACKQGPGLPFEAGLTTRLISPPCSSVPAQCEKLPIALPARGRCACV